MFIKKVFAENNSNSPAGQDEAYTRWSANRGAQQLGIGRNTAFAITRRNARNGNRRPVQRDRYLNRVRRGRG